MKKLALLFLLFAATARAQVNPATANLTAQDSGTCSTAGACLTVTLAQNQASSVVQLTGTWSGTIQFEGTTSVGGTFVSVNAVPVGGTTAVTSATGNGAWRIAVAGLAQVRARCSAFSSGPIVVAITASNGSSANNTTGGGPGAVSSVFTRTGAVTAQSGDYTCAQVTNCTANGVTSFNGRTGAVSPTLGDYTSATMTGIAGSGADPLVAYFLSPNCPVANTGQCFNAPANTQQNNSCSWTAATPSTVTCGTQQSVVTGSVTSNVATYTAFSMPATWATGNSITVTGFTGADTYLNQTCTLTGTTSTTVTCALTHANGSSTTNGVITNTSVGPFVVGDVGKQVMGWKTCAAFASDANLGANAITTTGAPVITAFTSGTQVSITSASNAQSTQTGCFVWGSPDDTAAAALESAYNQASFCPRVILAASYYMFTQPHFYSQPQACATEPYLLGNAGVGLFGNTFYAGGFELEGRGVGPTEIFLMPNFPNGDSCARGGDTGTYPACFVVPTEGRWHDFSLNGAGNALAVAGLANHALVYADVGSLDNIACTNYGAFQVASNFVGFDFGFQTQINQLINSGCGSVGVRIVPNVGGGFAFKMSIENSNAVDLSVASGSTFTCRNCQFLNSQAVNFSGPAFDILNAGTLYLDRPVLTDGGGTPAGTVYGYLANSNATVFMRNAQFVFNSGNANNSSMRSNGANTVYLQNTSLTSQASGFNFVDGNASSKLFDEGGNTGLGARTTISGQVFGEANSVNQISVSAGSLVLSAGWGSTAANTALTGGDAPIKFTITNSGTGQGASPTITYTFPTPYLVAPFSCTATQVGGTNSTGTFTSSSLSTTGVTFTFSLTPTASSTEIVQVVCVTP